uniref:Transposase n=1 Tax=Kitasatospora sp. CMC57 TaxID=3231513 RepID=A0AB33K2K3_9ACTN
MDTPCGDAEKLAVRTDNRIGRVFPKVPDSTAAPSRWGRGRELRRRQQVMLPLRSA